MPTYRSRTGKTRFIQSTWAPFVVGAFLILGMVGIYYYMQLRSARKDGRHTQAQYPNVEQLKIPVVKLLDTLKVSWDKESYRESGTDVWRIRVPVDLPIPSLHLIIQERINRMGMRILSGESDPISGRVLLSIGWKDSCFVKFRLVRHEDEVREKGRIAIIIDDFGDRYNDFVKSFLDLGVDITISVIPNQKMSTRVAREMRRFGCEVILHLPMEPLNAPFKDDDYIVLTDMSGYEVQSVVERSLQEIPGAVGVNNHMGSKVTSHRPTITDVLRVLKNKQLYFIDSRTTASTVAYDVARELGLQCGKRDVFLDTDKDDETVRRRMWELAEKARVHGFAIGIGHCQRQTLKILKEEIPKVQAQGYRFVFVSNVVR